jgi:hypothetical protein
MLNQHRKAKVVPGTNGPPKTVASSMATMSKVAATVTTSVAGVLKIRTGTKRLATAPYVVAKGKQVRLDIGPPSTFVATHQVSARP